MDNKYDRCTSLYSINIPDGVTSIGRMAFDGCASLTSVKLSNSLTSIEYYTFENCSKLASITIPESVTSIATAAFYGCTSLTSITIPESVTSIGMMAFYGCTGLKRIICKSATVPTMNNDPFSNVPSTCVLYLPNGKAESYKRKSYISKFLTTTVTVTDAGWASGCLTYPAKAPSGKAYYIKSITADVATLEEFPDGLIPYCTGFLYKNEPGTYTFTDATATPTEVSNLLKGTAETMTVDAESIYVLGLNDAGKVGIRLYTGTELSGNKAYMDKDDVPEKTLSSIRFDVDGETTGITENVAAAASDNAPVYNLQGQRVTTPRSGEIYIKNGKKFIK